jgi:DNA-binding NarL/FixJ family response regulator
MKQRIKILLVDDHFLVLKGLISLLDEISDYSFVIHTKTNCDDAYAAIVLAQKTEPFNILFTDLSFIECNAKINTGEALINLVKQVAPNLKIGVITMHAKINRIFNVLLNQDPLVYLLKDNCTKNELISAIQKMLNNEIYYSDSVHQKLLSRRVVEISMDEVSIQILKELPKHPKLNNLVGHIKNESGEDLKTRAIETKLADLRIGLNAINNTDLVLKAKELGIID